MGRKPKGVEFIRLLKDLSGLTTTQAFAKAVGKKQSNISNYLNGKVVPRKRALRTSAEHLFSWGVQRIVEISPIPSRSSIPTDPGLYVFFDSGLNVLYIGQAQDLRSEISQTLRRRIPFPIRKGPLLAKRKPTLRELTVYVSIYRVQSSRVRHNLESLLLRIFVNQTHNSNIGKFK